MKSFKDSLAREWTIDVNVATARNVRDSLQVDLFSMFEKEAARLLGDPCLVVDVLYVLCKEQCNARKLNDEDFGKAMAGDSFHEATMALMEAVIDFFPSSRRPVLRAMVNKANELQQVVTEKAMKDLEAITIDSLKLIGSN